MSVSAIAPMALFICVSSALRGYFQGYQNMVPTAVSNIIEAVGKLLLGLGLAVWAVNSGYDIISSAAFATLGITIGVGLSMLYLLVSKLLSGRNKSMSDGDGYLQGRGEIVRSLIKIAVPITLSSVVISLTRVIDLVMILRRLQAIGYTEDAANAIYGSYSTLAVSMFNLPASFVTPIALSLVPILTAAIDTRNEKKEKGTLNASLRLCGIITIPASLGLSMFSRPILELVFSGEESAINTAAPLLSVLALSVFFSCVMTVTNAILQAYGKERKPIISMLLGACVKVIMSYILIGIPEINIYGAPISTLLCDITVSAVNMSYIKKVSNHMNGAMKLFSRSLVASALSIGICGAGYYIMLKNATLESTASFTVAAIAIAAAIFVVFAFKLKAVNESDILLLPKGDKICLLLKKIKLM